MNNLNWISIGKEIAVLVSCSNLHHFKLFNLLLFTLLILSIYLPRSSEKLIPSLILPPTTLSNNAPVDEDADAWEPLFFYKERNERGLYHSFFHHSFGDTV